MTQTEILESDEQPTRGYAVGVQLFDRIRESGAVYVDKTPYVWKMVTTKAVNFFLSRPRRFGKSLLVDTLRCYFLVNAFTMGRIYNFWFSTGTPTSLIWRVMGTGT